MNEQSISGNMVIAAIATEVAESVEANIKAYSHVRDEILNHGKLDMFNERNFDKDVVVYASPEDVRGINAVKEFYNNFLVGFSDIQFTILDIFGQDNKLVKHWNFKGTHTGTFFGMTASGRAVSLDGVTLIRMASGKIAEERDFYDNLDLLTQLGQIPSAS